MAEMEFIMSENEQAIIMDYILKTGGVFLPCIGYDTPKYKLIKNSQEAVKIWENANMTAGVGPIFVLWDNISKFPIEFDKIDKTNKTLYYPSQGNGGPYIDYLPCQIKVKDGKPYLINGIVGYLRQYGTNINGTKEWIPVPNELKDKYNMITKYIRSISKNIKAVGGKRSYWIGKSALDMLKQNAQANVKLELP